MHNFLKTVLIAFLLLNVSEMFGNSFIYRNNAIGTQPELNLTALIVNTSINFQFQNKLEPRFNLYLGLGVFNIIQCQFGFSSQFKIRLRSELPIFQEGPLWSKYDVKWYQRINLLLSYEWNLKDDRLHAFGAGISVLLN